MPRTSRWILAAAGLFVAAGSGTPMPSDLPGPRTPPAEEAWEKRRREEEARGRDEKKRQDAQRRDTIRSRDELLERFREKTRPSEPPDRRAEAVRELALAARGIPEGLRDEPVLKALCECYARDADAEVREAAVEALAKLPLPGAVPFLSRELQSASDPRDRVRAAYAFRKKEDPRAMAALNAALRDPDPMVLQAVLDVLRAGKDPSSVLPLVEALRTCRGRAQAVSPPGAEPYPADLIEFQILATLEAIAGKPVGKDPEAWVAWWTKEGQGLEQRKREEEARARDEERRAREEEGKRSFDEVRRDLEGERRARETAGEKTRDRPDAPSRRLDDVFPFEGEGADR